MGTKLPSGGGTDSQFQTGLDDVTGAELAGARKDDVVDRGLGSEDGLPVDVFEVAGHIKCE